MQKVERSVCEKCNNTGRVSCYEPPIVERKYCNCEIGKEKKKQIEKLIKAGQTTLTWELLSI